MRQAEAYRTFRHKNGGRGRLACLPLLQLSVFPGYLCKRPNELWIPEKPRKNSEEPAFCVCCKKKRQKTKKTPLFQSFEPAPAAGSAGKATNMRTLPADS
jgi:hypothetical protein